MSPVTITLHNKQATGMHILQRLLFLSTQRDKSQKPSRLREPSGGGFRGKAQSCSLTETLLCHGHAEREPCGTHFKLWLLLLPALSLHQNSYIYPAQGSGSKKAFTYCLHTPTVHACARGPAVPPG